MIERDQAGAARIVQGLESVIESGEPTPAVLAEMDHTARLFVQYAQQPDNDIVALTAVMRRASAGDIDATMCSAVACPVLIVVGDQDFVHPADELASWFPQGQCETLRNVDHFATPEAFGFFDAALEFLNAV